MKEGCGMDLNQAIKVQQRQLKKVDQAMLKRSQEGRLTDYYLVQWYYQHSLNQVFQGLLKHQAVKLPNSCQAFEKSQGKLAEFQWFTKLAPYSKLMQQDSTYKSLQDSVKQVLDRAFVAVKWTAADDGWIVELAH